MKILCLGLLFFAFYTHRIWGETQDFQVFYLAGQRFLNFENLYNFNDGFQVFKYSPLFALFMAPLSWLPFLAAKVIWLASQFIFLFLLIQKFYTWLKQIEPQFKISWWWLFGLLFTFVEYNFIYGQINFLLLWLEVKCLEYIFLEKKSYRGAVLLALAILFKLTPLILVPYLFLKKKWQAIGATLLFLIIGIILPFVFYGWQGNLDLLANWYEIMTQKHSVVNVNQFLFNQNIANFFYSVFGHEEVIYEGFHKDLFLSPSWLASVLLGFTIVVLSVIFLYISFFKQKNFFYLKSLYGDLVYIFWLQVILSPLTWKHYFINLLPALMFLAWQLRFYKNLQKLVWIFLIVLITIPGSLYPPAPAIFEFYWVYLIFSFIVISSFYYFWFSRKKA